MRRAIRCALIANVASMNELRRTIEELRDCRGAI
jgi:hypothetical protein